MLDWVIVGTYYPVLHCGLDGSDHKAFWRSYYRYYGCTPESDVARKIEKVLILSDGHRAEWRAFQNEQPGAAAAICEKARACKVPTSFNPATVYDEFQCVPQLK